ncbi:conserved Plasmodium protein, unknown function [Plasmodium chabaudi adami]|uniref:Uncharacterized protein n=2 Tax=Plasmodium chabaudi adami TaxID=5826 RepID=A0A1D3LF67_PLACE|nr:conserved Plasmodium protein, unknown function [Plasmodium chabaudi adami]
MKLSIKIKNNTSSNSNSSSSSGLGMTHLSKNGDNVMHKYKKKNLEMRKMKGAIITGEKSNGKMASGTSLRALGNGNSFKLNGNLINEEKEKSEKNSYSNRYNSNKSFASSTLISKALTNTSIINKLASSKSSTSSKSGYKNTLNNDNSSKSSEKKKKKKKKMKNDMNGKVIKRNGDLTNEPIDKKKSPSKNISKSFNLKKNNIISSNINITSNTKKNYKHGKILSQPEKLLTQTEKTLKKNNIEGMEPNMDNKQIAENGEHDETITNEDNSNEIKTHTESGQDESMQKTDEIKENIQNGHTKNGNLNDEVDQENFKNSVTSDNTQTTNKNKQDSNEKMIEDEFNLGKTNMRTYETIIPHFIKGIYDPTNDIFSEENKKSSYINLSKPTPSLLPGYKSVTFEELNNPNYNTINNIHQNSIYPSAMFYPPFNYIPHMNCINLKEAYILKNHVTLNNSLLTSADISKGTIHRQYNVGVTYPYGVPYIDVKNIKNSYGHKKTKA